MPAHCARASSIANIAYRIKVRNQRLPAIDAWLKKGSE